MQRTDNIRNANKEVITPTYERVCTQNQILSYSEKKPYKYY